MGIVVSFAFIPIFLLAIALPIFIGVYVYRDANKRGMNGVLWMLVTILAPTFIGLIIYLLVRSNYSDMNCPACGTRVTETYIVCPNCGSKLRPSCPNCDTPVQPEWKVCPQCAEPLPTTYTNVTAPEKPKDKTLFKVLIAILLVPVLLIALIVVLMMSSKASFVSSGGYSISSCSADGFGNEFLSEDVKAWLDSCKNSNTTGECYILRYRLTEGDYIRTEYLIYQTDGNYNSPHIYLDIDKNIFRPDVFSIEIIDEPGGNIPMIHHIIYDSVGSHPDEIELTMNGIDIEEVITDISEPIYDEDAKAQFMEELEKLPNAN